MLATVGRAIDYFIPERVRRDQSDLMKVRTFIFLHLMGPAMGQSVILFLWRASVDVHWQFWLLEAAVTSFWIIPFLVKRSSSLVVPAFLSVQVLVFISLFGSFHYGGISSPFLPWSLIALQLGFFYLAERTRLVLGGVAVQLVAFMAARLVIGDFPELVPLTSLKYVNLISIVAALIYITLLSIYYETVMRASAGLEKSMLEHQAQADGLREAMKKAELASQQKSIFLAKMSHELRTPLNAVIGYSEMLRDDLEDTPANSQRADDLDRINSAGRHLLGLVTDVLDLSRIEANRLEVAIEPVAIAPLVRDVMATAAPLISKKDNRLILQMPNDPGVVGVDGMKLRQSLLNLLSNAAKFTSRGRITLTVIKRRTGGMDRLIFEVRDTGIGMSEDGLKKLFKAFSQAEDDTSQKFGGTGLGLALTQRFCTLMGGAISVESKLGQGSAFTIDIPCRPVDVPVAEAASA
ncbi:sensor histidine kinase [Brevundimonas sp. NPDC092305]|uniref:sensor histidine kinase n=1 Tax=Brevundimonas sp. NPDC092305 TaxID=3363957 RepID=UPI0038117E4E